MPRRKFPPAPPPELPGCCRKHSVRSPLLLQFLLPPEPIKPKPVPSPPLQLFPFRLSLLSSRLSPHCLPLFRLRKFQPFYRLRPLQTVLFRGDFPQPGWLFLSQKRLLPSPKEQFLCGIPPPLRPKVSKTIQTPAVLLCLWLSTGKFPDYP